MFVLVHYHCNQPWKWFCSVFVPFCVMHVGLCHLGCLQYPLSRDDRIGDVFYKTLGGCVFIPLKHLV